MVFCLSLSRKPILCLMKRLAFIFIALFSLNIAYVFSQESQESQESSSFRSGGGSGSSIDDFFPIWGITLGRTTWSQAQTMGFKVEMFEDGPDRTAEKDDLPTFWDHDGVGYFTSIYWTYSDDFNSKWKNKGFSWQLSYDQWVSLLRRLGFSITVTEGPTTYEWQGKSVFKAKITALASDGVLQFRMDFNYRADGTLKSSAHSLYSITVELKKKPSFSSTGGSSISSASSSGSSSVGTYTGEKPKSNMVLREMLKSPMGNVPASHELMKYGDVKKAAKGTYTVDDDSDRDSNVFFIFKSDNPWTSSMQYQGFNFDYYNFDVSKRYSFFDRKFQYTFQIDNNLAKAYAFMDYIIQDFKDLGIPLTYTKKDESSIKAQGEYSEGLKTYSIKLETYGQNHLRLRIGLLYKKP